MFRIFREPKPGEFFLVGGDCSQGGSDQNYCQFLSHKNLDFPIVYSKHGVAAEMTNDIFPMLEWIYDKTGVKPVVAFERNNGGASEMSRLNALNRSQKYELFLMKRVGFDDELGELETNRFGWDTTTASRPTLVSDWKNAIDNRVVTIYDEQTISQHKTFIINRIGKPIASSGKHDDAVISCAICYQLYQTCEPNGNDDDLPEWELFQQEIFRDIKSRGY